MGKIGNLEIPASFFSNIPLVVVVDMMAISFRESLETLSPHEEDLNLR